MSRNIPRVRLWRVTYWRNGAKAFVHDTNAPTKWFARYNASDAFIATGAWRAGCCDKITVGRVRNKVVP